MTEPNPALPADVQAGAHRRRSGCLTDSRPPTDRPGATMRFAGFAAIVVGGLVAAVSDPLDLYRGSWLAGYLVLVAGAAQVAMGAARHVQNRQSSRRGWTQFGCWNAGSASVVLGTLNSLPALVDVGSAFLVASLALAITATRNPPVRSWLPAYRVLLGILAVSIPIGVVLSHLRHA